jgi:hypothetical protein
MVLYCGMSPKIYGHFEAHNLGNVCPIDLKLVSFKRAWLQQAESGAVCCMEVIIFEGIVSGVVQ